MWTPVEFLRYFEYVCKNCPIFFRCSLKYVLCKYICMYIPRHLVFAVTSDLLMHL